MLVIRLQRTGRSGHASFRIIVQDSRKSPTSGNVVAFLGSYNPHNKAVTIDKEKTETFIKNGANPSPRVVSLLKSEGLKLPKWVAKEQKKKGAVRHPEKRRSTAPAGTVVEKPVKEEPKEEQKEEQSAEAPASDSQEETPATEETKEESPAAEPEDASEPETPENIPETKE